MARAQKGAEQLLAAAGLGEPAISQVVQSIVEANDSEIARAGGRASAPRPGDRRPGGGAAALSATRPSPLPQNLRSTHL